MGLFRLCASKRTEAKRQFRGKSRLLPASCQALTVVDAVAIVISKKPLLKSQKVLK